MTKQKVEIGGKWFEAELSASGEPVLSEIKLEKGKVFSAASVKHLLVEGDKFFVLHEFSHIDKDGDINTEQGFYVLDDEQIMITVDEF